MRVESRHTISFKKLIVEDSAKQALIPLIKRTENSSVPEMETMLDNYKKQLRELAKKLSANKWTNGTDIVFLEKAGDESAWKSFPALILSKGEMQVSPCLYLYDLGVHGKAQIEKDQIATIGTKIATKTNDWFTTSTQKLEEEAKMNKANKKKVNSAAIIKRIFG